MSDETRAPRPFRVFVVVLAGAGLLLTVLFSDAARGFDAWGLLVLLVLGVFVSENYTAEIADINVGLSYPLSLAAVVLLGPVPGAAVAAVSGVSVSDIRRGQTLEVIIFNVSQLVVATLLGSFVYFSLGGQPLASGGELIPWDARSFADSLVPLLGLATVSAGANMVLVSVGLSLKGQGTVGSTLRSMGWALPTQIPLAFVGFLMAQVLAISVVALPLFVIPLFLARQVYQRYSYMQEVYLDTVKSLVFALEAKDPYTRGHSERVAGYSKSLGEAMGMEPSSLDRLFRSALLHDIGKLSVASSVLSKQGPLSAEEAELIRLHPERGAHMVEVIPTLNKLAENVLMHHERLDGSGYPRGLVDVAIPLAPRILAVADAYDAMTTHRPYRRALSREEATAELVGGAGSQFDQDVVRAFIEHRVGVPEPQHAVVGGSQLPVEVEAVMGS
ncbi:MAG: HD-GYP domain-containing protein [Coriobacteriia bacterium]|nr:HD-GYP domain-containing protein [Coriobacteriia bacterium]